MEEEEEDDGDSGWGEGEGPCCRSYRGGVVAGDGVAEVVAVDSVRVCVADQVVARSTSVEMRRKMKNSDGVGCRSDDESLALGVCIDGDRGSVEIGVWGRENSTWHQTACVMTEVCTGWWDWNLG